MRKLLSTFLVLVICFSISTQSFAAESTMDCDMMISTSDADSISILAARHLEDMKAQIGIACEAIGFDLTTFQNM